MSRRSAGKRINLSDDADADVSDLIGCCCRLLCNHCSNWTWVVKEILAFGTRLRSTHCWELNYLKLCRPAYFVRTNQLLSYPGHEYLVGININLLDPHQRRESGTFFLKAFGSNRSFKTHRIGTKFFII